MTTPVELPAEVPPPVIDQAAAKATLDAVHKDANLVHEHTDPVDMLGCWCVLNAASRHQTSPRNFAYGYLGLEIPPDEPAQV